MKISKREKVLLVFAIVLALGAIYYFYFLSPFLTEMKDISAKATEKESKLQVLDIQNTQLQLMEKQIADLDAQNAEILKTIPSGYDQPELLVYLYQLIEKNGQKASYDFEEPADLVKLDNSKATLHFYTDYAGLKKVLQDLKESRFNNRIVTMAVTLEPEESDKKEGAQKSSTSKTTTTKTGNRTETTTTTTSGKTSAGSDDKTDSSSTVRNAKYPLQVVIVAEFFNLKGEPGKETPVWIVNKTGKNDLFS